MRYDRPEGAERETTSTDFRHDKELDTIHLLASSKSETKFVLRTDICPFVTRPRERMQLGLGPDTFGSGRFDVVTGRDIFVDSVFSVTITSNFSLTRDDGMGVENKDFG